MRKIKTPVERFWSKVTKTDSCWLWAQVIHHGGYGKLRIGSKKVFAHRFSYEIHKGAIPEGLVIDHLCKNRACVNPDHLEPVTNRENIIRGNGPTATNYRKEKCLRGHNNFYINKKGERRCMDCQVIRTKAWRFKVKHQPPAPV